MGGKNGIIFLHGCNYDCSHFCLVFHNLFFIVHRSLGKNLVPSVITPNLRFLLHNFLTNVLMKVILVGFFLYRNNYCRRILSNGYKCALITSSNVWMYQLNRLKVNAAKLFFVVQRVNHVHQDFVQFFLDLEKSSKFTEAFFNIFYSS